MCGSDETLRTWLTHVYTQRHLQNLLLHVLQERHFLMCLACFLTSEIIWMWGTVVNSVCSHYYLSKMLLAYVAGGGWLPIATPYSVMAVRIRPYIDAV